MVEDTPLVWLPTSLPVGELWLQGPHLLFALKHSLSTFLTLSSCCSKLQTNCVFIPWNSGTFVSKCGICESAREVSLVKNMAVIFQKDSRCSSYLNSCYDLDSFPWICCSQTWMVCSSWNQSLCPSRGRACFGTRSPNIRSFNQLPTNPNSGPLVEEGLP